MPSGGSYKKLAADEDNSSKHDRKQRKRWKAKAKKVAKSVKKTLLGEARDYAVGLSYFSHYVYCTDRDIYPNANYSYYS